MASGRLLWDTKSGSAGGRTPGPADGNSTASTASWILAADSTSRPDNAWPARPWPCEGLARRKDNRAFTRHNVLRQGKLDAVTLKHWARRGRASGYKLRTVLNRPQRAAGVDYSVLVPDPETDGSGARELSFRPSKGLGPVDGVAQAG